MTFALVVGHCDELLEALGSFRGSARITAWWGARLATVLTAGGRLLAFDAALDGTRER